MSTYWKRRTYTKKQFVDAVAESFSWSGVARKLELAVASRSWKDDAKILEIDISHFRQYGRHKRKSLDEICKKDKYVRASSLRRRLIQSGVKEYRCESCKRSDWENKPIPLELHHINHDRLDNRIENLAILCPNCHALNTIYSDGKKWTPPHNLCIDCETIIHRNCKRCMRCKAKSQEKISWPPTNELIEMVESMGLTKTAKKLGITPQATKARINRHKRLGWT